MNPTRAENKLALALKNLPLDFRAKTVLDIGSSTGGFTDQALKHGAKKVIAVEKGTNQMKPALRANPKVELHEKTDIIGFTLTEIPDIILADISFTSLTNILGFAKMNLIGHHTVLLVLLKPQFEAKPYQLKNGIIKNHKIRREIIQNFEIWLKNHNFLTLAKRDSEVAGRFGNLERFYLLKLAK
ncbi:MAG: TlyA family RNA methyltransferase [Candidatus Nomurabacteria bacterium]|jgi:23S rRNA (cytidine1920-2'-O)/16S rRNA (cytidine1409-2'-O)-methyltransferase|nr:TlyA family RNA methyltransferase [Candidatus Nomurabacteria bacterium]